MNIGRDVVLMQGGLRVPFVTLWTAEETMVKPQVVLHRTPYGRGIGYVDQDPAVDRDWHGTLWVRQGLARGTGRAVFPTLHARRQRLCMRDQLCQVCGAPAIRSDERYLYVMRATAGQPIAEGERTTAPPVCESCAPIAVRECPHLRDTYAAALVSYPEPWGVAGIVYHERTLQPVLEKKRALSEVHYEEERLRWTQAAREVRVLRRVTPVDLGDLGIDVDSAAIKVAR